MTLIVKIRFIWMILGYSILQILFGNNSNSEENTPNTDPIIHATITKKSLVYICYWLLGWFYTEGGPPPRKGLMIFS